MAIINPPAWLQAGSYSARSDRLSAITAGLYYAGFSADESAPMRPRQGVRPSYQGIQMKARAASTPNMTVIINAGFAYIDNHDTTGYGTYVLVNDADTVLNIPAAGGAGQYRKDSVCLSVYDSETAGSSDLARFEVISGPYAASAGATVRGSIPPNAIVLADVAIAPSQTSVSNSNITDQRNFTVSLGGIAPIPSTAAPNHPHPGQVWYAPDLDGFYYGDSSGAIKGLTPTWQAYNPVWSGLSALGNAVATGRYLQHGKRVSYVAELTFGSTGSLGTGAIAVTLPTTAASPASTDAEFGWQGTGRYKDGSGSAWKTLTPVILKAATTAAVFATRLSDLGLVSPGTAGYTWAAGATMRVQGEYEAA